MTSRLRRSPGNASLRPRIRAADKLPRASDIIFGITLAMLITALLVRVILNLFAPA